MADTDTDAAKLSQTARECWYWIGEFCGHGMTLLQAEVLAHQPGLDRHQVRAVLERGCDPSVAFDIYSA